MNKLQEKKLLYKIRSEQDEEAFGKLYDHYIEDIYRFIYYKVGDQHEAEDITSEVFLKIWDYITDKEKKDVDNFRALLYKIARTKVVDFYRSKAKEENYATDDILDFIASDSNTKAEVHSDFSHKEVLSALKQLKDNYQEVVILRYLQELSTKETAEVMDKSRTSVRVTLHRAVKKLRQLLDEQNT